MSPLHTVSVGWEDAFASVDVRVASRALLLSLGATGPGLTRAVDAGVLVRARRDHYTLPSESRELIRAVRVGGILDCSTALREAKVFAVDDSTTHIHLDADMSRMRSTRTRFVPLDDQSRDEITMHWWPLGWPEGATNYSVAIEDALASVLRCGQGWHALASIENALHLGLVSQTTLDRIWFSAPERVQYLRNRVDGRAESGQETVLRMIVQEAGLECEVQVEFPGLGRVDMVVEGCVVLEADSRLAHDGWELHIRDRRRDLLAAELGYMSLRPAYQHTMHEPDLVRRSILGLLDAARGFRRSFS